MTRAKVALVAGVLVVLAAFGYGVEGTSSTTVAGEEVGCGSAISGSWLLSGTDSPRITEPTADQRVAEAACKTVVQRARTGVLSTMAAGALLALLGWTALSGGRPRRRAPQQPRPRGRRPARGGRTATG